MNDKCVGIIGVLFGHSYKTFLIETRPTNIKLNLKNATENDLNSAVDYGTSKKYTVMCKRCGKRAGAMQFYE